MSTLKKGSRAAKQRMAELRAMQNKPAKPSSNARPSGGSRIEQALDSLRTAGVNVRLDQSKRKR